MRICNTNSIAAAFNLVLTLLHRAVFTFQRMLYGSLNAKLSASTSFWAVLSVRVTQAS